MAANKCLNWFKSQLTNITHFVIEIISQYYFNRMLNLNLKQTKKRFSSLRRKPLHSTCKNSPQAHRRDFSFFINDSFYYPLKQKNNFLSTKKEHKNSKKPRNSISTLQNTKNKKENPEKISKPRNKSQNKVQIKPFTCQNKQNQDDLSQSVYAKYCDERRQMVRYKRLRNDLIQNSLQLFSLCQTNLNKRQSILNKLKQELNLSWKKLCQMLSQSKSGHPEIVQPVIRSLIDQRKLIEEERTKMNEIMEMMKI